MKGIKLFQQNLGMDGRERTKVKQPLGASMLWRKGYVMGGVMDILKNSAGAVVPTRGSGVGP